MAIESFEGNTFVAFVDISGFKKMMRNGNQALDALETFYSAGYQELQNSRSRNVKVEGAFVSDCGILFTRPTSPNTTSIDELRSLLMVIKNINKTMVARDYIISSSIAYGFFKYNERIDLEVIKKNAVYGGAYIKAYLDNEINSPKLRPGQCRIVKEGLPPDVISFLSSNQNEDDIFSYVKTGKSKSHYYYWWMSNDLEAINEYETIYMNLEDLMYLGLLHKLQKNLP